ncbi:dehydrogenase [Euzebyella marina]|uniref:Dehydrogenase n=1 Tax=Euzebyella marina TaxID=1761453 RepID=A0A3G2LBR2_9FLAO|nr:PVC-type heme-binding CxxCH protein [Euzebyella marina]AYN69697.1 dehydrogenase [Euzebyella marina]
MKSSLSAICTVALFFLLVGCGSESKEQTAHVEDGPRRIEILFLGHSQEHHNSRAYFPVLASALAKDGINITYTEEVTDLNEKNLATYDGLIIYANHDDINSSEEKALIDYVKEGHAFIPIHCASFCFRNSEDYVDMVGGQFMSHETGTFTADIVDKEHPIMQNVSEFSTWDETYVHDKIADDIQILMERVEGDHKEPWTWVKDYGQGKVFYTAYGHDERTWEKPGFQKLIKEGIIWAVSDKVRENWQAFATDIPQLAYKEMANIPNYEKRDPAPKYQLPLSPEESAKLIQVPAGFKLELFASEPDIINPIAMNWDEKGRLWVIETVDYPNTVRNDEGIGDDKVKILEDTDGDGKADKVTVFAENLNIPTSFAFANGGIIVSQAPVFLFLKDTNGDDKADVRETIIDGWGTFDTHAGPSNLQYGIDNHVYGVLGYSGFEGSIFGKEFKFRQGVYRFNTDYKNFEFLTNTSNNTWGLGFTEDNSIFASTANNTHSVFLGIPNDNFAGVEGVKFQGSAKIDGHYDMQPITMNYRQVDVFGGFTAAAGHHFYTARNYPSNYWNKTAFVCEPTGGLVHISKIEKEGAGYIEKDGGNLFAGADEWVSPVEAKVGPDGSVWVADWYNFIVQHNPTPNKERGGFDAENGSGNAYVNPLRDKSHGRIWRVVPKKQHESEKSSLDKDNVDDLVHALSDDNMFWRMTAQRLLVESGNQEVSKKLYKLINDSSLNSIGQNPGALHALWTLDGLGAVSGNEEAASVVRGALFHPAAAVRKAAIQILPRNEKVDEALLLSGAINDKDPSVRLAALLYFSERSPSQEVGAALYKASKDKALKEDRWLSEALYAAAAKHIDGFVGAFQKEKPTYRAQPVATGSEKVDLEGDKLAETFVNNYIGKVGSAVNVALTADAVGTVINIGTVTNEMKFNVSEIVVEAGKQVTINFSNTDFMQHNLVIVQKGEKEKVGAAADKLAVAPNGAEMNYVPEMSEVLYATAIVNPEESATLSFVAPTEPGEYPFICTFPGHWRIMQGVMKVVSSK